VNRDDDSLGNQHADPRLDQHRALINRSDMQRAERIAIAMQSADASARSEAKHAVERGNMPAKAGNRDRVDDPSEKACARAFHRCACTVVTKWS
jgi:hypothetical protein